jgi:hypothetical protein
MVTGKNTINFIAAILYQSYFKVSFSETLKL